jgi:hypothetical protein
LDGSHGSGDAVFCGALWSTKLVPHDLLFYLVTCSFDE